MTETMYPDWLLRTAVLYCVCVYLVLMLSLHDLFSVLQWKLTTLLGLYLGVSVEVNCNTDLSLHSKKQ